MLELKFFLPKRRRIEESVKMRTIMSAFSFSFFLPWKCLKKALSFSNFRDGDKKAAIVFSFSFFVLLGGLKTFQPFFSVIIKNEIFSPIGFPVFFSNGMMITQKQTFFILIHN